jgi:hypothetical protein
MLKREAVVRDRGILCGHSPLWFNTKVSQRRREGCGVTFVARRVHHSNAHTTQPLNLEFEDLNNTTLQK